MQQHGPVRPPFPLALTPSGLLRQLTTPLLTLPILFAGTAVQAAPATKAEMDLYTRIAAVNVCIARSAGIDFDKAVGVAGETIAQLIQGQHQGMIQQVGSKALSLEQLRRGAVNSAVFGSAEICPKSVPPEVMKKVEAALKQAGSKPPAK
jgi:hypothetical protein